MPRRRDKVALGLAARSPGWYADPSHQYRLMWWVLRLRWWDGEMWTSFTAVRSLSWVPKL
jgi:hypothetical protein